MSEHDEAYKLGRKHVESLKNASEVTTWPRDEIEVSAGYFASGYLAGRDSMRAELETLRAGYAYAPVHADLIAERDRNEKLLNLCAKIKELALREYDPTHVKAPNPSAMAFNLGQIVGEVMKALAENRKNK